MIDESQPEALPSLSESFASRTSLPARGVPVGAPRNTGNTDHTSFMVRL